MVSREGAQGKVRCRAGRGSEKLGGREDWPCLGCVCNEVRRLDQGGSKVVGWKCEVDLGGRRRIWQTVSLALRQAGVKMEERTRVAGGQGQQMHGGANDDGRV